LLSLMLKVLGIDLLVSLCGNWIEFTHGSGCFDFIRISSSIVPMSGGSWPAVVRSG
jgi:hypothetical protein